MSQPHRADIIRARLIRDVRAAIAAGLEKQGGWNTFDGRSNPESIWYQPDAVDEGAVDVNSVDIAACGPLAEVAVDVFAAYLDELHADGGEIPDIKAQELGVGE